MLRKILALAVLLLASSITFAKDASADEQAIRALDTAWSHAAETKDLEQNRLLLRRRRVHPPNMPIAAGKNAIRAVWSQFLMNWRRWILASRIRFGIHFRPVAPNP